MDFGFIAIFKREIIRFHRDANAMDIIINYSLFFHVTLLNMIVPHVQRACSSMSYKLVHPLTKFDLKSNFFLVSKLLMHMGLLH